MDKPLRFLGHPVHPMLIHFPLAMFPAALVFDGVYLATGDARWADICFWLISVGLLGAVPAAVFGILDWSTIPPGTRAYRVGIWHGLANATVSTMFVVSWILRYRAEGFTPLSAAAFDLVAVLLALVAAWLGGELVTRHGVGVDRGANYDAPSSLPRVTERLSRPDVGSRVLDR
jgi:uncharacterized membrane protein